MGQASERDSRHPVLRRRRLLILVFGLGVVPIVIFMKTFDAENEQSPDVRAPRIVLGSVSEEGGEEYLSSNACKSCHPQQHASWHQSYHSTMTQQVSPDAVVAPDDHIHLKSRGREFEWERRRDEYWVTMPDPDWESDRMAYGKRLDANSTPPTVSRKIMLLTGSHLLQTYWVLSFEGEHREGRKL